MTGLEKILKHIEDSASAKAGKLIDEANKKAEEIIRTAQAEGDKKLADIKSRSERDIKASMDRGESAAMLQEKKIILETKQQIINEIIDDARDSLLKLPDGEYFDTILKMVQKYSLPQAGEIAFSADDRKRMPDKFEKAVSDALAGKKGASLKILNEAKEIDGGFILIYGDVEENCSFEALFSAAREKLQDKVGALLFST